MLIQDGKGSGALADVNKSNQLLTEAVTLSAFAKAARNGDAYSWTSVTDDIETEENMLSVINQSRSRLLHITKFYAWSDVAAVYHVHVPAPGTWAGTAVLGVNMNRASTKTADAVAYRDETGDTYAAANDVLALHTNETATDIFGVEWDFEGALMLGYDDCVSCYIVGGSAAINCSFFGYYTDIE